ncbi:MipA/OmpV family protein [Stenotrophomonas sp.]|uniref:MipA/OmpV family protein n=1 Tax=Stenotrophomonas sp. TaxID=69392 RepID=UPI00289A1603|nr:MipA/OmpV family protein [Stenotrophomonas sp.]
MNRLRRGWQIVAWAVCVGCVPAAAAQDAMLGTLLEEPGSAGLGMLVRVESSPYIGADDRVDLLPLYLYEGERFFLRSNAAGVRLATQDNQGLELFVERRLEGYPEDETPDILQGLRTRNSEADLGARYYWKHDRHGWDLSVRQDISNTSKGTELRAGYGYTWRGQRWDVQPVISLEWRNARLNDYYFGVEPYEADAGRPAYAAGSGLDVTAGVYTRYRFLQHWSLLGGVYATRASSAVRNSPLVDDSVQWGALLGAAYDFGNGQVRWDKPETPTFVKVFYGRDSADGCHMVKIMTFSCTDLNDVDPTDIWGVHFGRPFVSGLNGWPLDLVGYVGVLRHDEKGHQPDAWQIDAYMKAFYYGFPWSHRVKTRIGFGFGLSYAERVPYAEVQSQARRERNTSKLLNYLDPSIDISLGDIFGSQRWHDLYLGVGISHRSGIFGSAQMLGTVDGGSNYIYAYLEAAL